MFGPVWTALYGCIGVSAWLVWRRVDVGLHKKRAALRIWGWQLLVNALWPPAFFGLHSPALGMLVIVVLLGAIVLTLRAFWPVNRPAALVLLPYLTWVAYAAYLNGGFWRFNAAM